ncbi:MAG: hypothetical protein AAGA32_12335 [Pseudomonadota bacterium]
MLTREKLIREFNDRRASWPALLVVYGILVGTMIATAMAIT